jgi:TonB family protein
MVRLARLCGDFEEKEKIMSFERNRLFLDTRPGQSATPSATSRLGWRVSRLLVLAVCLGLPAWLSVSATETVESGNLNSKALSLPVPQYPAMAKQSHITGLVKVDILVNESGKVESAKAATGNTVLRPAAVEAALRAKFAPTLKAGAPVKVTGFLQYEFKLE